MDYDHTQYAGAAPHYRRGRPPYSPDLEATLVRELGLDGRGRLLDVGCGPESKADAGLFWDWPGDTVIVVAQK